MQSEPIMAAAIRAALKADNLSQAEFARRAGTSEKHVSQVLSGKATAPLATLDYWAFALGRHWKISLEKGQTST